jgi:hypothetical protein
MEATQTTSKLTAQQHYDDCVEFLRFGIGCNVAKPNRYEASETKVERRTIPGLKWIRRVLSDIVTGPQIIRPKRLIMSVVRKFIYSSGQNDGSIY